MKRGIRIIRIPIPITVRIMTGSTLGKTTPEDVARAFAAQHIMPRFYAGRLGVPYTEEPQREQDRPLTFSGTRAGGKVSPAEPGPTDVTFGDRERIITAMCYTSRHDYGLAVEDKDRQGSLGFITCGMTASERQGLRSEMAQLFDHHIEPIMKQAHSDAEQLKLIAAALRRAGLEEKDTPPHATVSLLASQYLKLRDGMLPIGDRIISGKEHDRLLAIERGHQTSFADARAAEAAIERAHADINTFASECLPLTWRNSSKVTADGSRRAALLQVLTYLKSMETEVEHLQKKNHEMQVTNAQRIFRSNTFHIEQIDGKPLEHYLELERLAQQYGVEKIVDAHAERKGELLALMAMLGRAGTGHDIKWMVQEIGQLKEFAQALLATKDALLTGGLAPSAPCRVPQVVRTLLDQKKILIEKERDYGTRYHAANDLLQQIKAKLGLMEGANTEAILGTIEHRDERFMVMKQRTDSTARMLLPQKGEAATTADVLVEIQRLQEAAKPIYGPSPVWEFLQNNGQLLKTILRISEALELPTPYDDDAMITEIKRLQKGQIKEPPTLGSPFGGGFFAGEMTIDGERYALVVAPKAEGEKLNFEYKKKDRDSSDGTSSNDDGQANSERINDGNHPAAQFCRSIKAAGHSDWYLPSKDELAMIYQNLGPRRETTPEFFREGAAEAFQPNWYWSSTENASYSFTAWTVGFTSGHQYDFSKDYLFGVRAGRRLKI